MIKNVLAWPRFAVLAACCLASVSGSAAPPPLLSMEQAIVLARDRDPGLRASVARQRAMAARADAADSLPDPQLQFAVANLPVNDWDFARENMTQAKLGVSQMLPRGDSRALQRQQWQRRGQGESARQLNRAAELSLAVAELWLDAFRARKTMQLIQKNRSLFEQLAEVVEANYSAVTGNTQQRDLVRAQLELTRLDDRLRDHQSRYEAALSRLRSLLPEAARHLALATDLPQAQVLMVSWLEQQKVPAQSPRLAAMLRNHPAINALQKHIAASETTIELVEQQYKPRWSINASYGYREDDTSGRARQDFLSVGVSVEVPWFSGRRNDSEHRAATAETEALRQDRSLALRNLMAQVHATHARLRRLQQREQLYEQRLLLQMQDQSEAALAAYTADHGDFADVMRARIDQLDTQIDALALKVEHLKLIQQWNYFFIADAHSAITPAPAVPGESVQ